MENSERDGNTRHLTCLLRNLYAGQEATVRTAHVPGASTGVPTHGKGHAESPDMQRRVRARGDPLDLPESLPQNQSLSVLLLHDFHQLL